VVGTSTQMFGTNGVVRAPNGSIEVPGSIEVVHPDGRDDQVDCGLTPHSWTQNKRAIRVYFRASYGADKWRHDLFRGSAEGNDSGVRSFDGHGRRSPSSPAASCGRASTTACSTTNRRAPAAIRSPSTISPAARSWR
jgi:hypothetical protein